MRRLEIWWRKKYHVPPKDYLEYTPEELLVEYLEDHYYKHPNDVDKFTATAKLKQDLGWDGKLDPDVERAVIKRLKRLNRGDPAIIEKYRTSGDEDLTEDEFNDMLDAVGRNLPGSKNTNKMISEDEFEDSF
jgi:hypothetical protein